MTGIVRGWLPYLVLARKSYRRQLQYRSGHFINNLASAVFGFVYMAVWQATAPAEPGSPYHRQAMTAWIGFTQALLWITTFHTPGLGIPDAVRSGMIGVEWLRPVSYFLAVLSRGAGEVAYNALYRSLPLAACFALTTGLPLPSQPLTYLWLLVAVLAGAYVGLCLEYLQGLSAYWTYEIRWVRFLWMALQGSLSGFFVPADLLPGPAALLAQASPLAALSHYPARIYLGYDGPGALGWPLLWCLLLTALCCWATGRARRHLEVQGG